MTVFNVTIIWLLTVLNVSIISEGGRGGESDLEVEVVQVVLGVAEVGRDHFLPLSLSISLSPSASFAFSLSLSLSGRVTWKWKLFK